MAPKRRDPIDLIIIHKNQPYLISPYFVKRVSANQGKFFFYYKLEPIRLSDFKKISFKKVLISYPDVKTFLPYLPALYKKEYDNLWEAILPPQMLQAKHRYIQAFRITSTQIRFAYYMYNKKNFFMKNIPFVHSLEPAASYFFNKALACPQNKNIAFCLDNEVIIIQKYFSDIQYFPNLQQLSNTEFLQAVQSITNIEINDIYFFLIKQKEKINNNFIAENKSFFFPSYQDFFSSKKPISQKAKSKKHNKSALAYIGCVAMLCFSFFFIFNNFYITQKLHTELIELRKLQKNSTQNSKTQKLFTRGVTAFHQQILQELRQRSLLFPSNILKEIEKLPFDDFWLVFFEQDDAKILLKIASLKTDFWEQNKTKWQKILKKDIFLLATKEEQITYFSLEIKHATY